MINLRYHMWVNASGIIRIETFSMKFNGISRLHAVSSWALVDENEASDGEVEQCST